MYEDPPEPTKAELDEYDRQQAAARAPVLRIEGVTTEAIKHIVLEAVERHTAEDYDFRDTVKREVKSRVDEQVDKLVQELGREQIAEAVRAALEEGWQETSRYGEPQGKRITLRQRLNEAFTVKYSDGYGKPEQTLIERSIRETAARAIQDEFKAELERAKAGLRAQVDELLKGKLVASLKEALGLR